MPRILAILPTLGKDIPRLNRAIESVRAHTSFDDVHLVVVNNSEQTELVGLLDVDEVVHSGLNLGYVGALELARRSFEFDYLWSIQDDMALRNDVLTELLREFEKLPHLAVASPILVRDGVVPARSRAGIFTDNAKTRWENIPFLDVTPEEFDLDVEFSFVSGSGALFRKEALDDVGGFNLDLYPLMHVDVDICARFLSHGWQLRVVRRAEIDHEIQGSTPSVVAQVLIDANTPVVEKFLQSGDEGRCREPHVRLDYDLVFQIARRSSFLFLDVASESEKRLQQSENARLHAEQSAEQVRLQLDEVYTSTSWRLSAPLRFVKTIFSKRPTRNGIHEKI